jgi:hypothetical protein
MYKNKIGKKRIQNNIQGIAIKNKILLFGSSNNILTSAFKNLIMKKLN